ncbi:MAG: 30S ribosomal protein S16 [Anaerolineae bacterium]|nr:30S ribosomal protein S16 [Anaerolineae bacterium]
MVRIRLQRVGLKKQPSYRIVIADSERARDGKVVETIGFYNPRTRPETIQLKEDRALYWLGVGAQPSDPVKILFNTTGTQARFARLRAGEALETLVAEADTAPKPARRPWTPRPASCPRAFPQKGCCRR